MTDEFNRLPLLAPMSAVAGRMSIQAGAHSLEKSQNGRGLLLGGAPGVTPGNVLILGGGVVGENAAIIATGMQAKVFIVDKSSKRLEELQVKFGDQIIPLNSDEITLSDHISECDLLIGGVLVPGANAPKLVSKEMISSMRRGSVIVDVAIDQGGCFETSEVTSHKKPTFVKHGVVHYCVPNIASRVSRTASMAISNIITPILLRIAEEGGVENTIRKHDSLRNGVYAFHGNLTNKVLSKNFNIPFVDLDLIMAIL